MQGEILIPDHPDGGQGIRATPQGGGDDLAHGTPDLPLDALQLRTLLIDLLLPLALLRKKLRSRFIKSFLFYVPYAVLAVMTVPAIFESTGSVFSAAVGFAAAVLLAYRGAALLPVALAACGVVFCTEWMMRLF